MNGKKMGTFYVSCRIENVSDRSRATTLAKLLVDTGSEFTWVPKETLEKLGIQREKKEVEFQMANGQKVTRSVGFAILRLENNFTVDEIVFAERGDLLLLGWRTLEGLNLTVDPQKKKLVAAGPLPAARVSRAPDRSLWAPRDCSHHVPLTPTFPKARGRVIVRKSPERII